MPFNSSGVYTLPSGYRAVSGTTILVTQHNPIFEDVQQALSLTMVRDGRAPMTGDLTLYRNGSDPLHAVTKQQLDAATNNVQTLGSPYYVPAGAEAVVNVPADAATLQEAIDGVQFWVCGPGASIKILVTGHQAGVSTIGSIYRPDNGKLVIAGPTPESLTFSSFDTPSGSAGARSIGVNVVDKKSAVVGSVLIMKGYAQSYPDSGSLAAGSAPVKGAVNYGYLLGSGDCKVTVVAGATGVTFSQAVTNTEVPVGSFLVVAGQIRRVTARPLSTTATVSSNWRESFSSHIYWSVLAAETGTIAATTGTITGTSTDFLSRVSPGDMIVLPDNDTVSAFASVTNNTSAALENSITLGAGTYFAVINRPWELTGAFEITGVSGNKLTISVPSWCEYQLPFRGLVPTTMTLVNASVSANAGGTTGISILSGGIEFDNIAIKGTGSTGKGIAAGGATGGAGTVTLTNDAPVIGFQYGIHAEGKFDVRAQNAFVTGGSLTCIKITNGASGFLDNINAYGGGTYSLLLDGGHAYFSRADLNCSYEDGLRIEVGGSAYGDWVEMNSNGGRAMQAIGASALHVVGIRTIMNGNIGTSGGLNWQNGGMFRATGFMAIRNRGAALITTGCKGEIGYMTSIGNYGGGVSADNQSNLTIDRAGIVSNFDKAIDMRNQSVITTQNAHVWGNSDGIYGNTDSRLSIPNSAYYGNGATDMSMVGGATAYVQGYLGSPNHAQALNKFLGAGSSIRTDAQIAMGP